MNSIDDLDRDLKRLRDEIDEAIKQLDSFKKIRDDYSNLSELSHKVSKKYLSSGLNGMWDVGHYYNNQGNLYCDFANAITRIINGDKLEDIRESINIPLPYLEKQLNDGKVD